MADLSTTFDAMNQAIGASQQPSSGQPASTIQSAPQPSTAQQAMDLMADVVAGRPLPPIPTVPNGTSAPLTLAQAGADVAKSAGTGAIEGAVGTATFPVTSGDWLHGLFSTYVSEPLFNAIDAATGRKAPTRDEDKIGYSTNPAVQALHNADVNYIKPISQNTGDYIGYQPIMRGINAIAPLYQPKSVAGEYGKTIGTFVGAGGLMGGITGALRRTGVLKGALSGAAGSVIPGAADEAAGQYTKGTGLEMPARLAGALTGSGLQSILGTGANALKTTFTSATPDIDAAQAAARVGVNMPRIALSNNPGIQGIGQSLKSVPFVGTPIRNAATGAIEDIGQAKQAAAELPTGTAVNAQDAGASIRSGLENYIGPVTKTKVSDLYDKVDNYIDPNVLTDLDATRNIVANIASDRVAAAMPVQSKAIGLVLPAVQRPGGLTYDGIKLLRTSIGQLLDNPSVLPADIPQAELKRIYGGLSDDLASSVANAGGPQATAAFQRANTYANLVAQRREQLATILGPASRSDEGIAAKMQQLAGSKSTADAQLLLQARKSVTPDEWNPLVSNMVGRLGLNNAGEFSPDRFVSGYAQISPQAKGILFGSSGNLRQSLDDIATVSQRFKQLAQYGNPSGTAQVGSGILELGALTKAMASGTLWQPLTVLGGFAGGNMLARMLAAPPSAAAIAKWSKAYAAMAARPTPFSRSVYQRATGDLLSNMSALHAQANAQAAPPTTSKYASGGPVDPMPSEDNGQENEMAPGASAETETGDMGVQSWHPMLIPPPKSNLPSGAVPQISQMRGQPVPGMYQMPIGKNGTMEFQADDPSKVVLRGAYLPDEERSSGLGVQGYQKLADWALSTGRPLYSEDTSESAQQVFAALKRRGYDVSNDERGQFIVRGR